MGQITLKDFLEREGKAHLYDSIVNTLGCQTLSDLIFTSPADLAHFFKCPQSMCEALVQRARIIQSENKPDASLRDFLKQIQRELFYDQLVQSGYQTLSDLADASPDELVGQTDWSKVVCRRLIQEAKGALNQHKISQNNLISFLKDEKKDFYYYKLMMGGYRTLVDLANATPSALSHQMQWIETACENLVRKAQTYLGLDPTTNQLQTKSGQTNFFWNISSDDDDPASPEEISRLRNELKSQEGQDRLDLERSKLKKQIKEYHNLINGYQKKELEISTLIDHTNNQKLKNVYYLMKLCQAIPSDLNKTELKKIQANRERMWDALVDKFLDETSKSAKETQVVWIEKELPVWCFDCDTMTTSSKKGIGQSLTCGKLYFCQDCYLKRIENGEKTPIDLDNSFFNQKSILRLEQALIKKEDEYFLKMEQTLPQRRQMIELKKKLVQKKQYGRFTVIAEASEA